MKKTYLQPEVAITEMELVELVAASDLTVDIVRDETGSPEDADARLFYMNDD